MDHLLESSGVDSGGVWARDVAPFLYSYSSTGYAGSDTTVSIWVRFYIYNM